MKLRSADYVEGSSAALHAEQSSSELMSVLEEYARTAGLDPDALLAQIRDLSDQPALGGQECLTPLDVAEVCASGEQSPSRREHLSHCEDCRTLIAASMPSTEHLEAFLAELATPSARKST